jgi:hypothetical protein
MPALQQLIVDTDGFLNSVQGMCQYKERKERGKEQDIAGICSPLSPLSHEKKGNY